MRPIPLALMAVLTVTTPLTAQEPDRKQLAGQARSIMQTYCYRCHGKDGKRSGGFADVLDVKKMIDKDRVTPDNAEESYIYQRMTSTDEVDVMPPPEAKERPTPKEIALIKEWIDAGAEPFPDAVVVAKERPYLTEADVYKVMLDRLSKDPDHAKHLRFITLTHLFNDPSVSDARLRLYHAGVSKLLNSLSWKRKVVLPEVLPNGHGAILAFDLRDLDWDLGDQWSLLIARHGKHGGYTYGLTHDRYPQDNTLNLLAKQVYDLTETRLPAVRADWLLAAGSLPPVYHELLNLPDHAADLEKQLGVHVRLNFQRDKLLRVGLGISGVAARANRLLERHDAIHGYYHKSYDFGEDIGASNLTRFPLGPRDLFPEGKHPHAERAFVHAGGELIWSLPNGMQGYLLVDGNDKRIDEAPAIVRDEKETVGRGTTIVNGLSCMACHKHGMITDFQETVRASLALEGEALRKALHLYGDQKKAQDVFAADRQQFLTALEEVCGPYLKVGPDAEKPIEQFPEPISATASPYLKSNLTLEQAARELGIRDAKELRAAIRNNPTLRNRLGLNALAEGNTIRREFWESRSDTGESIFQAAANELRQGTPRIESR